LKITAGEKCFKASQDTSFHDPLDIAMADLEGVYENLTQCAHSHISKIGEPHFFIVMLICTDVLIKGLQRRKFYADIFLPDPRPNQLVCMYEKKLDSMKRIWSLPSPAVMAVISSTDLVDDVWKMTKYWCDAFYNRDFHQKIRDQWKITDLSREESKKSSLYRENIIKFRSQNDCPFLSKPFDAFKTVVQ
jgi:hypothetical protein